MKTNWDKFQQSLVRLIYDGTAQPGRSDDDSARLYINKKFRSTIEDHSSVNEEIASRNIQCLIHYTPAFNVFSILKYGLIPRSCLEKETLKNTIFSVFPNDNRMGEMLESNCINLSFPNYKLFHIKRKELGVKINWAVIVIDPEIISQCPCLFFHDKATSCITENLTNQNLNNMFEDISIDDPPKSLRDYLKLPINYTTNPQAELLINSVIPPKFIKAAYVENLEVKKKIEKRVDGNFREKILVSDLYFQPRHDHNYWEEKTNDDFRKKYEAEYRASDGHYVRSRAELVIDNWLYQNKIIHEYEKFLPIKENVLSDFYLPETETYIEFWGMENDERYSAKKKKKLSIYKKYKFRLIELNDSDIINLDDKLFDKLRDFKKFK